MFKVTLLDCGIISVLALIRGKPLASDMSVLGFLPFYCHCGFICLASQPCHGGFYFNVGHHCM